MRENIPILIIIIPFFVSLFCGIIGSLKKGFCFYLALMSFISSLYFSYQGILATKENPLLYNLGGWNEQIGICFKLTSFGAILSFIINFVGLSCTLIFKKYINEKFQNKIYAYYALFLFFVTGNLGLIVTNDVFNLYVFLEILSLSAYALVALAKGEGYVAALRYLMMGTIGASFYLLGIGVLYLITGSLNMDVIRDMIPNIYNLLSLHLSFFLILIGLCVKFAFFPFHIWLPFAYSKAIEPVSVIMAAIFTKVSLFALYKIIFLVFSKDYILQNHIANLAFPFIAGLGMLYFSVKAFSQVNIKQSFCYVLLMEVSMMFGGLWLGNSYGYIATFYHIIGDMIMMFLLFMFAAILKIGFNVSKIEQLKSISIFSFPILSLSFVVAVLSILGLPPFAGFFSKLYFIKASIYSQNYFFLCCIIISSFILLSFFLKTIENMFFYKDKKEDQEQISFFETHGNGYLIMLNALLLISSISLICIGIFAYSIIQKFIIVFFA